MSQTNPPPYSTTTSPKLPTNPYKNPKLLLTQTLTTLLLITTTTSLSPHHTILHSSCSTTRFPDLCRSSIASSPSLLASISSPKEVILASLNLTHTALTHSIAHVRLLHSLPNNTARELTALHDCLDMFSDSLDELSRTAADLKTLSGSNRPPHLVAAELEILVSAAMTNQDSCLDGFSHDSVSRHLRESIVAELADVTRMCSNALAMIKHLITGQLNVAAKSVDVLERRNMMGWPRWVGEEDRGRMTAEEVVADVVVAKDGSGDYETVTEAVEAAPLKSKKRYVIRIKEGRYEENVEVGKKKTNIMFVGDGRNKTVITGNRNVVDGSTTFKSATLAVVGAGFLARSLRIENTAGPSKHQAVALRVGSDLSAFYDCDIIAYQDTLYLHSLRHFFRSCLIQGTVDFIFGNAAAVLQDCDIQVRRPNSNQKNMVTASGRNDPNEPTGLVLHRCRITAAPDLEPVKGSFETYLGRPWKEFSRTVVMESVIEDVIHPAGWHEWDGAFAIETLYYGEFNNSGGGSGTAKRVDWKGHKVIGDVGEARQFTVGDFLEGSSWLVATGFPFGLGLSD